MAEIRINDLGGLSDYGTSISDFSGTYEGAIGSAQRDFTSKVTGEKAEAITAFFDKLDAIQSTVFSQFPTALNSYAETVTTYHGTISGLGFSRKAYSSDSGAAEAGSFLTGEQVEEVTDVTEKLQKAFNKAADALGEEPESLSGIESDAAESLADAANMRQQVDSQMQEAYSSFTSGLETGTETLTALKPFLANARYVTQVPLSVVFSAISKGYLDAGEMYYFDAIKTKEDAAIVEAVISQDTKKIKAIFDQDVTKVSDGVFTVMANEMMQWIDGERLKPLNAFIDGMEGQLYTENQPWLLKLHTATIELGDNTIVLMQGMYDADPTALQSDSMITYQKYINSVNKFLGFVETLYVLEVGTSTEYYPATNSSGYMTSREVSTKVTLKVTGITDSGINLSSTETVTTKKITRHSDIPNYLVVEESTAPATKTSYTSKLYSTAGGVEMSNKFDRITELKAAREEAQNQALKNLAKTVVSTAVDRIVPGSSMALATVMAVQKGSGSEVLNTLKGIEIEGSKGTLGGTSYKAALSFLSDYLEGSQKITALEQELDDTRLSIINQYLDKGAWVLEQSDGEQIAKSFSTYYDFPALLRLKELDTYGITKYVESVQAGENGMRIEGKEEDISPKALIQSTFSNAKTSQAVQNYLLGESDLSLTDLSAGQLKEVEGVLTELSVSGVESSSGSEGLEKYLRAAYAYQ